MKVIIYGVNNLYYRRWIERYIREDCRIVAYSDSVYDYDIVDGKTFISPDRISREVFDFVILAIQKEENRTIVKNYLISLGIDEQKIVIPFMCDLHSAYTNIYHVNVVKDMVEHSANDDCTTLLLGNSASLSNINKDYFNEKIYDMSVAGGDLYYNLKLVQYAETKKLFSHVKRVYISMEYVDFNWDMSIDYNQYKTGQIFALQELHDWHNANRTGNRNIEHSIINYDLFGQKVHQENVHSKLQYYNNFTVIQPDFPTAKKLASIWRKVDDDRIKENRHCFSELVNCIKKRQLDFAILISPICLEYVSDVDKTAFASMREMFYLIINEYDLPVYDNSELYKHKTEFFRDVEHLNMAGSADYSRMLARELFG